MSSARWQEIRITADGADLGTIDGKISFPDYDFVWDSRRKYSSNGRIYDPSTGDRSVFTAAEAARGFWDRVASGWPSAKMTVRTVSTTEWVSADGSPGWLLSALGLDALQGVYDGSPGDAVDDGNPSESGL
ncbi:hypothetical protein Mbo2_120 [Rhodococcus phage Mbo2]|uniref:Uncharacterized protein n=1 Tax=Rhodococcus phage Mbo2 TaxID=2936911 RepID=A0A9E7IH12_9CAUD|nr:hypothetical protein Mbo2_120 [Rhodococcus phage Mbo2]